MNFAELTEKELSSFPAIHGPLSAPVYAPIIELVMAARQLKRSHELSDDFDFDQALDVIKSAIQKIEIMRAL